MADEKNGMYDVKANTLVVGRLSDPGRSGKNNEDYYGVFTHTGVTREGTQPVYVAVVADGIGGSASGEDASRLAVATIRDYFGNTPVEPSRVFEQMRGVILKANASIYEKAMDNPSMRGMGTTIVLAVTIGDQLHLVHAGDSRAYLLRDNNLHLLTLDHTWAQEAIDANRITPEEALHHPNKNVIKRFLGPLESVDVDTAVIDPQHSSGDVRLPANRRMLESQPMTLQAGDTLLICSDGLNDELSDEQIEKVLRSAPPQPAVKELIDRANAAGGRDNITAVILQKPQAGVVPIPVAPPTTLSAAGDATVPMTLAGAGGAAVAGKKSGRSWVGSGLIALAVLLVVVALLWILVSQGIVNLPGTTSPGNGDGRSSVGETPTLLETVAPSQIAAAVVSTGTPTATPTPEPPTATAMPAEDTGVDAVVGTTATETATPTASAAATDTPLPTTTPSDTPTPEPPTATAMPAEDTGVDAVVSTTATETATPTASAAATDTPTPLVIGGGATNTPVATQTRAATSTPLAGTPTATPTGTPTITPTGRPTQRITTTPTATASAAGSSGTSGGTIAKPDGAVASPLAPSAGELLNTAGNTTFTWATNFTPTVGYAFEFIIWPASAGSGGWQQGRSPIGAERESCKVVGQDNWRCTAEVDLVKWQDNPKSNGFGPGTHYWGVAVVRIVPGYQPQFLLSSAGQLFDYQRPSSAPPPPSTDCIVGVTCP